MVRSALILLGCFAISPIAFAQSSGSAVAGKKIGRQLAMHYLPRSGRKWQQTPCGAPRRLVR